MGGGLIFFFHSLRMLESHALCTRLHKMKHSCNAQQLESQIALSPPPPHGTSTSRSVSMGSAVDVLCAYSFVASVACGSSWAGEEPPAPVTGAEVGDRGGAHGDGS